MPKVQPPELKGFMDKRLSGRDHILRAYLASLLHLKSLCLCSLGNRALSEHFLPVQWLSMPTGMCLGVLRGFDQFMNIVLDNAVDEKNKTDIGMVVRIRVLIIDD